MWVWPSWKNREINSERTCKLINSLNASQGSVNKHNRVSDLLCPLSVTGQTRQFCRASSLVCFQDRYVLLIQTQKQSSTNHFVHFFSRKPDKHSCYGVYFIYTSITTLGVISSLYLSLLAPLRLKPVKAGLTHLTARTMGTEVAFTESLTMAWAMLLKEPSKCSLLFMEGFNEGSVKWKGVRKTGSRISGVCQTVGVSVVVKLFQI